MTPGKLIIISAPSGCGKSTIIGEIIKNPDLRLEFSISATTREPRRGEVDGVNYYFLTTEQFEKAIKNDELVEYEEVYAGRYYGTLKSEIARIQAEGKNVILDIDVKGGVNVKEKYGDRLLSRGTDSIEAINQRVGKAAFELTFAERFDRVVVNDILREAVDEVEKIIKDFVNA